MGSLLVFCTLAYSWASAILHVDDCPGGLKRDEYVKVNAYSCYRFVLNEFKTFHEANNQCKQHGGHLTSIESKEVNEFIRQQAMFLGAGSKPLWIGLRYEPIDASFRWLTGNPISDYNNFPDTFFHKENECVALTPSTGVWETFHCDSLYEWDRRKPFVCEYPVVSQNPWYACPPSLWGDVHIKIYENNCYHFELETERYFRDAQEVCEYNGGSLPIIKSPGENSFIVDQLNNTNKSVWIGLRYDEATKAFRWVDGSSSGYVKYGRHTKGFDCVAIDSSSRVWKSMHCSKKNVKDEEKNFFVCEYSTISTTTTPTTTTAATTTTYTTRTTTIASPSTSMTTRISIPTSPSPPWLQIIIAKTLPPPQRTTTAKTLPSPLPKTTTVAQSKIATKTLKTPTTAATKKLPPHTTTTIKSSTTSNPTRTTTNTRRPSPRTPTSPIPTHRPATTTPQPPPIPTPPTPTRHTLSNTSPPSPTPSIQTHTASSTTPTTPTLLAPTHRLATNTLPHGPTKLASTSTAITSTIGPETRNHTLCHAITCELECGLDGFKTDPITKCFECECEIHNIIDKEK